MIDTTASTSNGIRRDTFLSRSMEERERYIYIKKRIWFNIRTRVQLFPSIPFIREAWRIKRRSLTSHQYEKARASIRKPHRHRIIEFIRFPFDLEDKLFPASGCAHTRNRRTYSANRICILFKRPAVIELCTLLTHRESLFLALLEKLDHGVARLLGKICLIRCYEQHDLICARDSIVFVFEVIQSILI